MLAVADHLANGQDISTDGFNTLEARSYLESQGFTIETKQQEKFELSITAEGVMSTDNRFTMDNISLVCIYKSGSFPCSQQKGMQAAVQKPDKQYVVTSDWYFFFRPYYKSA